MTSRTGDKKFHTYCESCKYFRMNALASGRLSETCAVTGEQLVWKYGEFIKSDRCPFKEVKNV